MNLSGRKVLVTGGDGFIGSHLVETLLERGCEVRATSYYNSHNYWGWLEDIPQLSEVDVRTGDIRDRGFCQEITQGVDVVFHLAALIAIPYSYRAPDSYIETNVRGTSNMCLAALENGCSKFVHTSTSEVYGTAQYVPIDENHPLQPQSPYSASKIGADAMARSYGLSMELPLVVARPFNTYGPRQSLRAVIPTLISQIASGEEKIQVGDLSPYRDFNFVQDTCEGFCQLAETNLPYGEIYNIGSGKEYSIYEVGERIQVLMGKQVQWVVDPERIRPERSEVQRLLCNCDKLKEEVGYSPRYSIEDGLQETIQWFLQPENLRHFKVNMYNT